MRIPILKRLILNTYYKMLRNLKKFNFKRTKFCFPLLFFNSVVFGSFKI